jgi:hypothetical protein
MVNYMIRWGVRPWVDSNYWGFIISLSKPEAKVSHKIFDMPVSEVYVHYVNKVERKGRTEAELIKVITWLTGLDSKGLKSHLKTRSTFREFFKAAKINPNAKLITGSICGVKITEIDDPLMKKIRYMDKLVDELAKGRPMEKILRSKS